MSDPVFKLIEITGTSSTSSDDAVLHAVEKASKTLHGIQWFQVCDMRGYIHDGKVQNWQVTLKLGVKLDE